MCQTTGHYRINVKKRVPNLFPTTNDNKAERSGMDQQSRFTANNALSVAPPQSGRLRPTSVPVRLEKGELFANLGTDRTSQILLKDYCTLQTFKAKHLEGTYWTDKQTINVILLIPYSVLDISQTSTTENVL